MALPQKGITISVAHNQNTIHINLFSSIVKRGLVVRALSTAPWEEEEKRNGLPVIKEHVEFRWGQVCFGFQVPPTSASPFHNTCFSYTKVISSELFQTVRLFPPKFKRLPRYVFFCSPPLIRPYSKGPMRSDALQPAFRFLAFWYAASWLLYRSSRRFPGRCIRGALCVLSKRLRAK